MVTTSEVVVLPGKGRFRGVAQTLKFGSLVPLHPHIQGKFYHKNRGGCTILLFHRLKLFAAYRLNS